MSLISKIEDLRNSHLSETINQRLEEFKSNDWFSELCFCLLTANSKAKTAISIQEELGTEGFLNSSFEEVRDCILRNKHRFHNNKARFILEARKFANIKELLSGKNDFEARKFLVENIKGLGLKESSHFLRNVGFENVAILDRHILNLMVDHSLINNIKLNKKNYLDYESKLKELANTLNINLSELDLYLWYLKTGEVLK
jgi:N-glycosylase/DNA lyase